MKSSITYRHGKRIKTSSPVLKCLCLFLLLQIAPLPRLEAQTKWYKLTSPDNDFTISFPSRPNYASQTDPRVNTRIERFSLTFENHYMEVQYVELSNRRETKEQVKASLEGVKSGYLQSLKNSQGRLQRLLSLPEGGYQFDSVIPLYDGTPSYNRTRIYVFGSRQYTISCTTWNAEGLDELLITQFFNSFSLKISLPTEPKRNSDNKTPSKVIRRSIGRRIPKPKEESTLHNYHNSYYTALCSNDGR